MPLASGLNAQLGFASEVTYGTFVTSNSFLPLLDESISENRMRLESEAIIAGRRVLSSAFWSEGSIEVGGDISLQMMNRGLGKLFTVMFGAVGTTGAGPFTHTFTPGDLATRSLAVQFGIPDVGGTVRPFSYSGVKVTSWEMACAAGEIATLNLSTVGRTEQVTRVVTDAVTNTTTLVTSATAVFAADDVGKNISGAGIPAAATIASVTSATNIVLSAAATATASGVTVNIGPPLAVASYPTSIRPLTFVNGACTVGGVSVPVTSFTIKGENSLKTDRRFVGQSRISEPLEAGALRVYDGTLEVEFTDLAQYRRYLQATEFATVLSFAQGADTVTFTLNTRFDGTTPQVGGMDIITQSIPFKCVGSTDAAAITAVLVNGDSAP